MHIGVDLGTRRVAAACPEVGFAFSTGKWGDRVQPKRDYPAEEDIGYALGRQLFTALMSHPGLVALGPGACVFHYERPLVGRPHGNVATAVGQALSAGALLSQVRWFGAGRQIKNSSTWKKELVGHGHADKDTCRAWLEEHHPASAALCAEDKDLVDAHCIALWAELASGSQLPGAGPARVLRRRRGATDEPA